MSDRLPDIHPLSPALQLQPPPLIRFLALPLALAIFAFDTFTNIQGAVAVLYVLVPLLLLGGLSRRGILLAAGACAGLTLLSFALRHGIGAAPAAILRCAIALAAMLITTLLLLRDHASRLALLQANRELSRSEHRYRSIFEQTRFSLFEQDFSAVRKALDALRREGVTDFAAHAAAHPDLVGALAGKITTLAVNDATLELLGARSEAEVVGPAGRFIPAQSPAIFQVLEALFEGRNRFEGKGQLRTLAGQELTVLVGISFPEDAEELKRVVVGIVDITGQERTQQALMAAQAELARASRIATVGALSASIAHEVNQPLGAVVMNAQTCLRWLAQDPPDIAAAARAAERVARDGKRASEIVARTRGLLVRDEAAPDVLDLALLVQEVLGLLEREIAGQGTSIVLDLPSDPARVRAGRVEMQQVLINLVTNALHALSPLERAQQRIEISVSGPKNGLMRLGVRDSGKGIDPADLEKLFSPFFTTKVGGMGMGLAICRATVEARGGQLVARNHPEGGALFEFTLPAADETPEKP
ncbi:sensor histidine kinase [Radicibacter daui]|uniref:sensor histidine kinase n=1 Tax=Radicibacter daui TaxID=3064829 RepID=UPI004046C6E7